MKVTGHGISIDAPDGWEARIFRREGAAPVLHAASFPLHDGDGDFGAAATGRMRADDMFLALVEYMTGGQLQPGQGLFGGRAMKPRTRDFRAAQLQVTRPGQLGWQQFFTAGERPCCLYGVIQPGGLPVARLVGELAAVLETLRLA